MGVCLTTLGSLRLFQVKKMLSAGGVVLSLPPFVFLIRSPFELVAKGLSLLYADFQVLQHTEAFCDFHVNVVERRPWY